MNKILKYVVLCGLFVATTPVAEEPDVSLLLGGWSYHQDRSYNFNESHDVIGVCYNNFCLSRYKNSFDNVGMLAYYQHALYNYKEVGLGLRAGIMGGYEGINLFNEVGNSGYIVYSVPYISYNIFEVSVLPYKRKEDFNIVYTLNLRFDF